MYDWVHIQGTKVQFSKRTHESSSEARAGLQAHLDAHFPEAGARLRALPAYPGQPSVSVPGHTWRVQDAARPVTLMVGNDHRTFRRPAPKPAPQQESAPARLVTDRAVRERRWRSSGRSLAFALSPLLLLFAVGLLIFARSGPSDDTSAPTCDGKTMGPGATCVTYKNMKEVGRETYEEILADRKRDKPENRIIGGVLIAAALLLAIPVAAKFRPSKPWGKPVAGACPRCGKRELREKPVTGDQQTGRGTVMRYAAVVTLCTPACGYTTARAPSA